MWFVARTTVVSVMSFYIVATCYVPAIILVFNMQCRSRTLWIAAFRPSFSRRVTLRQRPSLPHFPSPCALPCFLSIMTSSPCVGITCFDTLPFPAEHSPRSCSHPPEAHSCRQAGLSNPCLLPLLSFSLRSFSQVVDVPSYLVRVDSEKHIDFAVNSPFAPG